jgi:GWxTD domain-containing protein
MRKALAYCSFFGLCAVGLLFLSRGGATAQDSGAQNSNAQQQTKAPAKQETIAKPKTAKQKKKDEEKLKKELESPYKKWLNEEVFWIITPEERSAFLKLNTDDERESFIENFWLKRDPTPDTPENEYEEEYYRRVAYANETFASGIPGWKTDRGMIYIKYGAPDEREEHPTGGTYERPIEEGGGETTVYPFEKWRYRYIEGLGNDINIEFVDPSLTGEYHMTADPSEKDALTYVPGAGLTLYEQMGLACKACRFTRSDGTHLGTGNMPLPATMNQFDRLAQFANLQKPPITTYKDLNDSITTSIKYNLLPIKVRADYIPVTDSAVYTNITLQFDRKDLSWKDKQGVSSAYVEVNGVINNMSGKYITSFDHDLAPPTIPTEMLEKAAVGPDIFQTSMALKPGLYKLTVKAKDENSGNESHMSIRLDVPHLEDGRLTSSSLILADTLEKVDRHSIGTGKDMFVIGEDKVRPRMPGDDGRPDFKKASDPFIYVYWRLYNFEPDNTPGPNGAVKKADGVVKYELLKDDPKGAVAPTPVAEFSESATDIIKRTNSGAAVMVVKKQLPLSSLDPGQYTLKMTATDDKDNQTVTDSAHFTVN